MLLSYQNVNKYRLERKISSCRPQLTHWIRRNAVLPIYIPQGIMGTELYDYHMGSIVKMGHILMVTTRERSCHQTKTLYKHYTIHKMKYEVSWCRNTMSILKDRPQTCSNCTKGSGKSARVTPYRVEVKKNLFHYLGKWEDKTLPSLS